MVKQWVRVGVVVAVVAMVASAGWSQQERRGRFSRMTGDTGKYISIVLLLNKETSAKVEAVYEKEGENFSETMREIWQSASGDREAAMAKFREEREKSSERIKAALDGILSEGQINDIEPILERGAPSVFRSPEEGGRDPFLWALASLSLSSDQRARMLGVTVAYARQIQPPTRFSREGPSDEEKEKIRKLANGLKKDAGAILTAEQKKKWQDEAAKLREQWDEEREEFRERMRQR